MWLEKHWTVKTIKEENIYSLETKSEPKQQIMYIYICLKVNIWYQSMGITSNHPTVSKNISAT